MVKEKTEYVCEACGGEARLIHEFKDRGFFGAQVAGWLYQCKECKEVDFVEARYSYHTGSI